MHRVPKPTLVLSVAQARRLTPPLQQRHVAHATLVPSALGTPPTAQCAQRAPIPTVEPLLAQSATRDFMPQRKAFQLALLAPAANMLPRLGLRFVQHVFRVKHRALQERPRASIASKDM